MATVSGEHPTDPAILHGDLDAFYASVEQLLDASLRGRPVIVGGAGRRGVVCAASYEARRYGVRSAMPGVRARQLCPDGVFVAPRMQLYSEYSERVMTIIRAETPLVEQLSVDEAFCDVRSLRRVVGDGRTVAAALRTRIRDEVGLVASIGVATTKFLAKVASDHAKPDGLFVVEPGHELEFLHPLPIRVLWGVGPKTAERLERFAVRTVGDVARLPLETMITTLGKAAGEHLHQLAHNRDPRPVVTDREAKSIGHEETFGEDLYERIAIERELLRLTGSVAARMRSAGVRCRTVSLKARYPDFSTLSRARTLPAPTDVGAVVYDATRQLLDQIDCGRGLRLVGVHCSNLVAGDTPTQSAFDFDAPRSASPAPDDPRRADIERTMDDVRRRFGKDALRPAALLDAADRPNPALREAFDA